MSYSYFTTTTVARCKGLRMERMETTPFGRSIGLNYDDSLRVVVDDSRGEIVGGATRDKSGYTAARFGGQAHGPFSDPADAIAAL